MKPIPCIVDGQDAFFLGLLYDDERGMEAVVWFPNCGLALSTTHPSRVVIK